MQKNSKNASILIWSIFLSIIISISFIGISTKISKNLQQSSPKTLFTTSDTLNNKLKQKDYTNQELENGDKIIFESNNLVLKSLKKDEEYRVEFDSSTNMDIGILNGGGIFNYSYKDNGTETMSGIISYFSNLDFNNSGTGELIITNIGSHSNFYLSGSTAFYPQEVKYIVTSKVGNKEFVKTSGEIINP